MRNKFIIDKEINLNECDFLKTKIYANNLTKIIKNSEPNKVFTIGLFGNWGTGKSSIIKTAENDFDQQKIKFITYDAWQYVNDSFRRMFLRKLREKLKYEETDLMKKFYENESTDVGNKYQFSSTRLTFVIAGLVLLLAIITVIPFNFEYKFPIYAIFTLLGLLITIISGTFHQLKISVTKPHLFAPEQFEECFKEMVSNSLSSITTIKKTAKWIKGDKSIQNLEKLVIVIDNIDRCSNDVAYNLLTDIKTFLSSEPYSIAFVIPVDDEALKSHILKNSKTDSDYNKETEEFLRKFFNVTIRIKPYGETDMYAFAKQICEKSGLNFKPETINIASKEYAKNPRRIIQLFNNLLAEMNYYDTVFITENETLICCILIIREEYLDYYKEIVNSPRIFNENYSGENENLKRFVRIAQTALGKVEVSNLSKILTNSHHQFDNVPADVKDAINTIDTEKVVSIWDTEKNNIADYIFDRFDYVIKNNFIDNELVPLFDMLAQINFNSPFEAHFAKKIDEKILESLPNIISKTNNHENLCIYALLREKQRGEQIKVALIEESKRIEKQEKGKHWESLFNAVLKVFQDKKTSIALSSTYTLYKQVTNYNYHFFSEEQIDNLISAKYIQDRIAELPTDENGEILLSIETEEYKEIKWLFERKGILIRVLIIIFLRILLGKQMTKQECEEKVLTKLSKYLNLSILVLI
jgi:ssRNA-specific RNase YbeY (16S rRNA maturation enzyme)